MEVECNPADTPPMTSALTGLIDALAAVAVGALDFSQPLGPDTPVIGLPEIFAPSPGVTIETISRYDAGPGVVLEHTPLRGAHRHSLRRAHPLDHG